MATKFNDRINVRIGAEEKELIKHAAAVRGFKSLSEFVVYCLKMEAAKIISDNNSVLKSFEDKKVFIEAILNPLAPNENLKNAQLKYQRIKAGNEN